MAAQDLDADGMECAEPRHAFERAADQPSDAFAHFPRRLVRERHREDLRRVGLGGRQDVGNARRQHPRLAGTRTSQDEQRTFSRLDRFALLRIEAFEVSRGAPGGCNGARRNGRPILPLIGRFGLRDR